jgi:tetratricopeptide (TPR) repeat protein
MSPLFLRSSGAGYQTLRSLTAAGLITACLFGAIGCSGAHGTYTKEQMTAAQEKIAMIKSGTEWQMAHQQFLAGDLEKSLKTVDRSIELNPKVAKSHVLRGRVMLEKSRLEEARAEFLKAQELDPKFVEAAYYLGIVYERVNEYDQALASYRQAMELDPSSAQYVVAAAEMLMTQHKLDEAEHLLTERRVYLEYNAAIRQTLGHIELLRNNSPKAAQYFSEALLLAPGDQQITEDLVQAQILCAKYADAEMLLTKLLDKEENKGRRDLKAEQAHCLISMNRPVEARTILQELVADKEGANDLRAWGDLGTVAAILKDKANLRASMNRVMAIAPDRPEGYMLKAMYCKQDNRLDDAIAQCDIAISKATDKDASPYILKAMIQQDQAKFTEAHSTLEHAIAIDPGNPKARALLGVAANTTITSHPDASN